MKSVLNPRHASVSSLTAFLRLQQFIEVSRPLPSTPPSWAPAVSPFCRPRAFADSHRTAAVNSQQLFDTDLIVLPERHHLADWFLDPNDTNNGDLASF